MKHQKISYLRNYVHGRKLPDDMNKSLSCMILFSVFSVFPNLALKNVNKDYVIFLYFCNLVNKSDQKPKMKNGMNKTYILDDNSAY